MKAKLPSLIGMIALAVILFMCVIPSITAPAATEPNKTAEPDWAKASVADMTKYAQENPASIMWDKITDLAKKRELLQKLDTQIGSVNAESYFAATKVLDGNTVLNEQERKLLALGKMKLQSGSTTAQALALMDKLKYNEGDGAGNDRFSFSDSTLEVSGEVIKNNVIQYKGLAATDGKLYVNGVGIPFNANYVLRENNNEFFLTDKGDSSKSVTLTEDILIVSPNNNYYIFHEGSNFKFTASKDNIAVGGANVPGLQNRFSITGTATMSSSLASWNVLGNAQNIPFLFNEKGRDLDIAFTGSGDAVLQSVGNRISAPPKNKASFKVGYLDKWPLSIQSQNGILESRLYSGSEPVGTITTQGSFSAAFDPNSGIPNGVTIIGTNTLVTFKDQMEKTTTDIKMTDIGQQKKDLTIRFPPANGYPTVPPFAYIRDFKSMSQGNAPTIDYSADLQGIAVKTRISTGSSDRGGELSTRGFITKNIDGNVKTHVDQSLSDEELKTDWEVTIDKQGTSVAGQPSATAKPVVTVKASKEPLSGQAERDAAWNKYANSGSGSNWKPSTSSITDAIMAFGGYSYDEVKGQSEIRQKLLTDNIDIISESGIELSDPANNAKVNALMARLIHEGRIVVPPKESATSAAPPATSVVMTDEEKERVKPLGGSSADTGTQTGAGGGSQQGGSLPKPPGAVDVNPALITGTAAEALSTEPSARGGWVPVSGSLGGRNLLTFIPSSSATGSAYLDRYTLSELKSSNMWEMSANEYSLFFDYDNGLFGPARIHPRRGLSVQTIAVTDSGTTELYYKIAPPSQNGQPRYVPARAVFEYLRQKRENK